MDDGAVVVAAGGAYGTYVDLEGTVRSEAELITKYRDMAQHPEVDDAINEIVNESIAMDEETPVSLNLDGFAKLEVQISDDIKNVIHSEFNKILDLFEFKNKGYDIYRRWYVDGRLFFHGIIDNEHPELGIKEIRAIDPRKIRKVREVNKRRLKGLPGAISSQNADTIIAKTAAEYYIYNDRGFNNSATNQTMAPSQTTTGMRIAKDSIINIVSGVTDTTGQMVLSYLHKAMKPLNQLRVLEDAVVIYRLSRAPERRVWYIDVGNLPKAKAEQYMRELMLKHKNRLVYDSSTGDIRDDRKFMTMLEDYWLTRREGGRGTEVTTLPAGQNLGQMEDVLYFQKRLYQSLGVPSQRLEAAAPFSTGRPTEISRDEVKFNKFIVRLRRKFAHIFIKALERQLILKQIVTYDEWLMIQNVIQIDFAKDNYFTELKDSEILQSRIEILQAMDPSGLYVNRYYSHEWVRKHVLKQTDEQMMEIDGQIAQEAMNPQYQDPQIPGPEPEDQGGGEEEEEAPPKKKEEKPKANGNGAAGADKHNLVAQAKLTYGKLVKKTNRTPAEMTKFRSAVQILSHIPGDTHNK